MTTITPDNGKIVSGRRKKMKKQKEILKPSDWGLAAGKKSELMLRDFVLTDFAELYGTPLYVLDETRLSDRAASF